MSARHDSPLASVSAIAEPVPVGSTPLASPGAAPASPAPAAFPPADGQGHSPSVSVPPPRRSALPRRPGRPNSGESGIQRLPDLRARAAVRSGPRCCLRGLRSGQRVPAPAFPRDVSPQGTRAAARRRPSLFAPGRRRPAGLPPGSRIHGALPVPPRAWVGCGRGRDVVRAGAPAATLSSDRRATAPLPASA